MNKDFGGFSPREADVGEEPSSVAAHIPKGYEIQTSVSSETFLPFGGDNVRPP